MGTSPGFRIEGSLVVSVRQGTYSAVRDAHVIVVSELKTVEKCAEWRDAVLLIYATGLGKVMIDEKDWQGTRPWEGPKAIRYHSQAKASPITVVASSDLQKHGNVMQALRACSEGGTWSCVVARPANPGTKKVAMLDDLPSVRQFLFKQRRIVGHKDATGRFQKK